MDPILYIERGLEYQHRKSWGRLFFIWSLMFLSLSVMSIVLQLPPIYPIAFEILFLLFLCTYIANALTKIFFLHLYKSRMLKNRGKTYEVLVAEEKAKLHNDDVIGFLNSSFGDEVMKRLGISRTSIQDYIRRRNFSLQVEKNLDRNLKIDLPTYVLILHDNDRHFASYLRNQRIMRDDLMRSAKFVQNHSAMKKQHDRVWSRKVLHDFSPFEMDALKIEDAHDVYFTTPVLNKLSSLDDNEKLHILRNVINNAKIQKRKNILISDINNSFAFQ